MSSAVEVWKRLACERCGTTDEFRVYRRDTGERDAEVLRVHSCCRCARDFELTVRLADGRETKLLVKRERALN